MFFEEKNGGKMTIVPGFEENLFIYVIHWRNCLGSL